MVVILSKSAHFEQNLSKLKCPKTILWGTKDFCFDNSFLKKWTKIYPEAKVYKLEKAGHYLLEDDPEFIEDV